VSLVYEAVDLDQMRQVAVKMLAPAFARNPRTCQAARQEPLIMQRLRHPSVPKVYGFGDAELGLVPGRHGFFAGRATGGDGAVAMPCVAMELLNGVALARRLAGGPMPWREAVEVAATIADLLAVAHRRGIAHRDLSPLNVMLTSDGVKIIDFGLATVIGSPMAHRETAQDVYSLGVLLYQMLTGRSPYPTAAPDAAFLSARVMRPAPTPVLAGLGVPRAVADLCRDCMAKRPGNRPESAHAALALWSALIPMA
jgi:serine/threonine-protein kinase